MNMAAIETDFMTSKQRVWTEIGGWLAALTGALIVVAQSASTARSELLFRDADSLIVALFVRSLAEGTAQNWAMSTVLFMPEIAVFTCLWWMFHTVGDLEVAAVLAVSAVVNCLAIYGALRFAAGRARAGRTPVAAALGAFALFGGLVLADTTASRDALELASLSLTSTYYVATVVALIFTVGVLRRLREGTRRAAILLSSLTAIAAISTLSNPLYAVWVTAPILLLLGYRMLRGERTAVTESLALLGGTGVGYLARIPFRNGSRIQVSATCNPTYGESLCRTTPRFSASAGAALRGSSPPLW